MLLVVTVRAGAKHRKIEELPDGSLKVHTTVAPEKGKANRDVVDMLAEHFKVPRSAVEIVSGHIASKKRVKITA